MTLTINGQQITVTADYSILEAAESINIPALCYSFNSDVVGSCRLCVVEIEVRQGLKASCAT